MKNKSTTKAILILSVVLFFTTIGSIIAQIANSFPYDSLIHTDSNVIFTEMFENPVSSLTTSGNWNTLSPNSSNILSDPSVPANSHGRKSLRLISLDDNTTPNENTLVYKMLSPGITDSIFVRYYVKYDINTVYHHSGLWVGGKNPPSTTPGNIGGVLPAGNQEFHVGTEIKGLATGMPVVNSLFGFYTYWMGMHPNSSNIYYGNDFPNNSTNDNIDLANWNCIEVMVKLNNPVIATNGELKLWINGILISHLGYKFPTGSWSETHFTEGTGTQFEGFQFRNDADLNLNYIWLRNYNTNNAANHSGNIYFDHLVVAKKYIGPISTSLTTGTNTLNTSTEISIYPNPANEIIEFSSMPKQVSVFNIFGQLILQEENIKHLSTASLQNGLYVIRADNTIFKIIVKH